MKRFRWVLYAIFLLFVLACGMGYRIVGEMARSLTGGGGIMDAYHGLTDPRGQFPGKQRLNILIVGMDYNRDYYGQIHPYGQRSDTIMILSVDLYSGKLQAISVPRDTYVEAPDGQSGKINGTFARGGTKLLVETLQQLLGVGIDYYVVVKPTAVREVVDAVGGVNVETIDEMHYKDSAGDLDIDLPKGPQRLNGRQAEGFVRFREVNRYRLEGRRVIPIRGVKGSKEEGDIRRTARQQQLVRALVQEGLKPGNWMRAPQIVETGFSLLVTNLTRTQVLALGTIVRNAGPGGMPSATLPGKDAMRGGVYFYELEKDRAQDMVEWLINGDTAAMRRLTRIDVKNGTGTKGLAKKLADMLDGIGYKARADGNAPAAKSTTITYRKAAFESAADDIQSALGCGSVAKDPQPANDWEHEIDVTLGEDVVPRLSAQTP